MQLWVLINIAWFPLWLYLASKGWSPGKLAMGIRIVTIEGRQPGWRKAILREIGKPLGGHDKRAGTIVVRKPEPGDGEDSAVLGPPAV